MGFFSWIKSNDKKPVRNRFAEDGPTPCKMIAPDGREWIEDNYQGYGVFGGMDFYELLADLNPPQDRVLEDWEKRIYGIELDFSGKDVKRPKIVSQGCRKAWEDLPDSKIDPLQGYFGS